MNLCQLCDDFDVRALLIATEAAPSRPNVNSRGRLASSKSGLVRDGIARFHPHQPNLRALRSAATTCDLCSSIWDQFSLQRQPFELTDAALDKGVGNEQIYLGTTTWDTGLSSVPHVVAIQHGPPPHNIQRQLANFDVCFEYGKGPKDHSHLLTRLQAKSAADETCTSLARDWIDNCRNNHTKCKQSSSVELRFPTRVIDVSTDMSREQNEDEPLARLVQGSQCDGAYSALSYCWGPDRDLILTHANESRLRSGIHISEFPGTLRDGIIVTRKLGIRYIWIDALCIFQDQSEYQESRDDWVREAARMRDVYRGAVVTLEAASASRGREGFLNPRAKSGPYSELKWKSSKDGQIVYLRPISDIPDNQLLGTTIFTRGWTLQERLLAPRTLSFGTRQISFECAQGFVDEIGRSSALPRATESYLSKSSMNELRRDTSPFAKAVRTTFQRLGVPAVINVPGLSTRLSSQGVLELPGGFQVTYYDYWHSIVERFTERRLTDTVDRLPALSGLADEFQRVMHDTYIAGMWKSELVTSLVWECDFLFNPKGYCAGLPGHIPPNNLVAGPYPDSVKPGPYVAPSWSWASVQGKVAFFPNIYADTQFTPYLKVKDIHLEPMHLADPLGALKNGHLNVSAPFLPFPNPLEDAGQDYEMGQVHRTIRAEYIRRNDDHISEFYQHHKGYDGQTFGLIKILRDHPTNDRKKKMLRGLVVESRASGGGYRRLFCFRFVLNTFDELKKDFFKNIKVVSESDMDAYHGMKPAYEQIAAVTRELETAVWAVTDITLY